MAPPEFLLIWMMTMADISKPESPVLRQVAVRCARSDSLWPAALVAENIAPGDGKTPMPFCVATQLSRDADGGVSGATRGLAAFGLMEIEAGGLKATRAISTA